MAIPIAAFAKLSSMVLKRSSAGKGVQLQLNGKDFDRFSRNIVNTIRGQRNRMSEAVEEAARVAEGSIKKGMGLTSPDTIDTGQMRASTNVLSVRRGLRPQAKVGPTVDYAIYPHEGLGTSRKYGRRPFIEVGLEEDKNTYDDITKKTGLKIAKKLSVGL